MANQIDTLYQTVQAKLNKEQLGYLRPMYFDLFTNRNVRKLFDRLFTDLKTDVRKMNWMLDGKDLANLSEYTRQCLEHYTEVLPIDVDGTNAGCFLFPDDFEYVNDVFFGTRRVDKIHYSDLLDLEENIYAAPSDCKPMCSKVGNKLIVKPDTINKINLHYIRCPKQSKWTYTEFGGKPMFNPDANDFQDLDAPKKFFDELVSLVFEDASVYLREFNATQSANQEQSQEAQLENRQ